MGYDMYWVEDPTPEEQAVKAAARAAFDRACAARDAVSAELGRCPAEHPAQVAVHGASRALDVADVGYFRLTMSGMSVARECLLAVGAMHDRGTHPPFPQWSDFDPDEDAYEAASAPVLSASVEYPGIPVWKVCSNDGWVVTPIECRSAVLEAAKHQDALANAPSYVTEFLVWIGKAAERGGFRVH